MTYSFEEEEEKKQFISIQLIAILSRQPPQQRTLRIKRFALVNEANNIDVSVRREEPMRKHALGGP